MRNAVLSVFLLFTGTLTAQTNFTDGRFEAEALAYSPAQRPGVSNKDFEFGKMVLEETVRQTENDWKAFNLADYMNVLIALIALEENEADIQLALQKFIASEGSCEYLVSETMQQLFFKRQKPRYVISGWAEAKAACLNSGYLTKSQPDPQAYALARNLDTDLVRLIANISEDDQRFRGEKYDPEKQTPLDRKNEALIDQLYERYGTYLGNTLVGEAYNSTMWIVIQHSRPETMERYLPVIHEAVLAGELPEAPLRMLIDRIQTNKTGKQVFGSQVGVPLLPPAERQRIIAHFGLDKGAAAGAGKG